MEKKEIKKSSPLRKPRRLPYYTFKSKKAQRLIIQEPWSKPMAAQHLAAALIQRNFRRYIGLRKGTKMLKSELKLSTIGSPLNTVSPIASSGEKLKSLTAQDQKSITAKARLMNKFKRSQYFPSGPTNEEKALRHFCAAKIQAAYKMSLTRRLVKYHRFPMYHIAAIQIQWAWRSYRQRLELLRPKRSPEDIAALKVQKAWRAFMNVKIFKYYKDFINFREKGDPSMLIKSINPQQAALLDAASQVHVRFRLGGQKFPPLIYYKIYTHGAMCDVNSFAPRNYMKMKKMGRKATINISLENKREEMRNPEERKKARGADGWYERLDNNGWRPVSEKILSPYDHIEASTANKPKLYHWNKMKRKQLTLKQRRAKKLKWLRVLYRDAKKAEMLLTDVKNQNFENPFDDSEFMHMKQETFDGEVDKLIEWCDELDFDKYLDGWQKLATSGVSDLEMPNTLHHEQLDNKAIEENEYYKELMNANLYNTDRPSPPPGLNEDLKSSLLGNSPKKDTHSPQRSNRPELDQQSNFEISPIKEKEPEIKPMYPSEQQKVASGQKGLEAHGTAISSSGRKSGRNFMSPTTEMMMPKGIGEKDEK